MRAKRFFSILLCILMLGSIFPVSAFAEEDPCAGGHDYVSELTVPPTQDSEGIMTWSCTRCGDSYTESVPRLSPDPEPQTETFSVFYELCGHGDEIAPVTAEAGSLLVRPEDPQADGYVFQGWYRDAGYETAWDFDQDTVQEETTLFAYWVEDAPVVPMSATDADSTADAYTVTLDPGAGTGEPITYICSFDMYDSLPTSATSAAHLHFYRVENNVAGFNLNVDYCPESFTAPENCLFDGWDGVENIKRIPSGNPDVTVTARWKAAAYTVTLDPGDGTGEPITYSCPFGDYDSLPTNAGHLQFYKLQNKMVGFRLNADYCPDSFIAPENYLFDGWDGIDKIDRITDGKPNVTVTARWKLDQTRAYGPIGGIPRANGGYV